MVDVVANHVGPVGNDFSTIKQFNLSEHYHDCQGCPSNCQIQNWGNQKEVEHCRLAGLPDLDQDNPYVFETILNWIQDIIKKYEIDGLRIDTVPEINVKFWNSFVDSSQTFQIGEVFDGRISYLAGYQPPLTGLLSYPMYFSMINVFARQSSMYELRSTINEYMSGLKNPELLATFLDNHDNPRFLNLQKDKTLYKSGLVYTMFSLGIPIVYYGTEQGFDGGKDPQNREPLWTSGFSTSGPLFNFTSNIVHWRKQYEVWNYPQIERYADNNFYAFTRGTTLIALTNVGNNGISISRNITYHPYKVGDVICNLFYFKDDCITVTNSGFYINLNKGESKIYVPK